MKFDKKDLFRVAAEEFKRLIEKMVYGEKGNL